MTQENATDAKKRRNNYLFGFFTIIIVTIAIGCSTKKVVGESDVRRVVVQHTDTLRDSVWVERTHIERDSVIVFQRGDTVYRDRWRTIYKDNARGVERERVVIKRDTIQVARDVVIERKPSRWAQIKRDIAALCVGILLSFLFIAIIKRY